MPRTFDRFIRATKGACVGDDDISRLTWLKVDIDTKAKGKLSASESEIGAVGAVALETFKFLDSRGWPSPLTGFSGNGYWLLYRVDLPNDSVNRELLRRAVAALALRFNSGDVEIDLSAANPARLVPFFGTKKMKGEPTSERPHRYSELLERGSPELVSLEQMENLAALTPTPAEKAPARATGRGFMKLQDMLDEAGVRYSSPTTAGDITWFGIYGPDGNCPFGDSSGNGGKCGVGQDKEGKLYGKCFAADHPWHEWKDKLGLDRFFSSLPTIVVNREMKLVTAEAWDAVTAQNVPPLLFARGSTIVELSSAPGPKLTVVDKVRLRHIVERCGHFGRIDARGVTHAATMPKDFIEDMMAQRPIPLPQIVACVDAPFFDPSGRLVCQAGYHPETRVYLQLPDDLHDLEIPERPTAAERSLSLATIDDLLADFAFVSEADRANAVAKLLDPFARTTYDGITPLYVVTSPVPGSGKGLLIDVLTIPATGERVPRTPLISGNSELEKRCVAWLVEGTQHVHFDNFEGRLDSPVLASFLTAPVYSGRLLGVSAMKQNGQRINLSLSGNNVTFGGDISRRVVLVQLDPGCERPEERSQFRHDDLADWATKNRRLLVTACLTLVQSWVAAGMPTGSVNLGSFERWSRTMSGILEHVGMPGFLANGHEIHASSDAENDAWHQWVRAWWNAHGNKPVRATDLASLVDCVDSPPFLVGDSDRAIVSAIGKALRKVQDRIFGDLKVRLAYTDLASASKYWRLERLDDAGAKPDERKAAA